MGLSSFQVELLENVTRYCMASMGLKICNQCEGQEMKGQSNQGPVDDQRAGRVENKMGEEISNEHDSGATDLIKSYM